MLNAAAERQTILEYRNSLIALYQEQTDPSERALLLVEIHLCNEELEPASGERLIAPERAAPLSSSYRVTNVAPERVFTPKSVRAVPRKATMLGIPVPATPSSFPRW